MSDRVSNDQIYQRIEANRLEAKGDIRDVADKLDDLQAIVNRNEVKQAVSSTKLGTLITGITILASAITTLVINLILRKNMQ